MVALLGPPILLVPLIILAGLGAVSLRGNSFSYLRRVALIGGIVAAVVFVLGLLLASASALTFTTRVIAAGILAARLFIVVAFGLLYVFSMSANDLLIALVHLKVPHRIGMLFVLGSRLLPVTMRTVDERRQMLKSRGFRFSAARRRLPMLFLGGSLLVRSVILDGVGSGIRLGETMASRGYLPHGEIGVAALGRLTVVDLGWLMAGVSVVGMSVFLLW